MEFSWILIGAFILFIVLPSIKQINQYERGIRFMFGKYIGIIEPGWTIVWPIIQGYQRVDIRTKAVDVPTHRKAITPIAATNKAK